MALSCQIQDDLSYITNTLIKNWCPKTRIRVLNMFILLSLELNLIHFLVQGLYQMLEEYVTIRCRQQDVNLVRVSVFYIS